MKVRWLLKALRPVSLAAVLAFGMLFIRTGADVPSALSNQATDTAAHSSHTADQEPESKESTPEGLATETMMAGPGPSASTEPSDEEDRSAEFTPDIVQGFIDRMKAIEEVVGKHIPTGASSEAFFDSLGDDGSMWESICNTGGRISSLLDAADSELGIGNTNVSGSPILEVRRFGSYWPQLYPHIAEAKKLIPATEVLLPMFDKLKQIQLPCRIFMIGTEEQRANPEHRNPDTERAGAYGFISGVSIAMVGKCHVGTPEAAAKFLEHVSQVCFSLIPTTMEHAVLASNMRLSIAQLLLGIVEAKLLPPHSLIQIDRKLRTLPLSLEFVGRGDALEGLVWRTVGGTPEKYMQHILASSIAKLGPRNIKQVLDYRADRASELDPATPLGRLYAPIPFAVTTTDALAAVSARPKLREVFISTLEEFSSLESIVSGRMEELEELAVPDMQEDGLKTSSSTVSYWKYDRPSIPNGEQSSSTADWRTIENTNLWQLVQTGFALNIAGCDVLESASNSNARSYHAFRIRYIEIRCDPNCPFLTLLNSCSSKTVTSALPFDVGNRIEVFRDRSSDSPQSEAESARQAVRWCSFGGNRWRAINNREFDNPKDWHVVATEVPWSASTRWIVGLSVISLQYRAGSYE